MAAFFGALAAARVIFEVGTHSLYTASGTNGSLITPRSRVVGSISVRGYEARKGESHMKQRVMLTITSLLSILS